MPTHCCIQVFIPPPDVAFYAQQLIMLADATLTPTSSALESEAVRAFQDWTRPLGTSNYLVGPASYTEADIAHIGRPTLSEGDAKVMAFLDEVHKSHGDRSVVYVGQWLFPEYSEAEYPKDILRKLVLAQ
jgi:hypothetical protein